MDPAVKKALRSDYHRLSKLLHPDKLAADEAMSDEEKERRGRLMERLTVAYERGDAEEMAIIEAEIDQDEPVDDREVEERVSGLMRSREALIARRDELHAMFDDLERSALEQLRQQTAVAGQQGRDLLAELADELAGRANDLEAEMAGLKVDEAATVMESET